MYKEIYESWLNSNKLSDKERAELIEIKENESEIEYRFGKSLEFGTAGMRGIIGLGTNMMNIYTVKRATQGLSEYIKTLGKVAMDRGVVISYDTRRCSYEFAYASATVLCSNGIKAYLFSDVHPVPMLSYAVRELKTIAGIMITASHNPKEYNGYKVYGEDGAQMSPEATEKVVEFIEKIGDPVLGDILCDQKPKNLLSRFQKALIENIIRLLKNFHFRQKKLKRRARTSNWSIPPFTEADIFPSPPYLKRWG